MYEFQGSEAVRGKTSPRLSNGWVLFSRIAGVVDDASFPTASLRSQYGRGVGHTRRLIQVPYVAKRNILLRGA